MKGTVEVWFQGGGNCHLLSGNFGGNKARWCVLTSIQFGLLRLLIRIELVQSRKLVWSIQKTKNSFYREAYAWRISVDMSRRLIFEIALGISFSYCTTHMRWSIAFG